VVWELLNWHSGIMPECGLQRTAFALPEALPSREDRDAQRLSNTNSVIG
jgi:hypothetical protein